MPSWTTIKAKEAIETKSSITKQNSTENCSSPARHLEQCIFDATTVTVESYNVASPKTCTKSIAIESSEFFFELK